MAFSRFLFAASLALLSLASVSAQTVEPTVTKVATPEVLTWDGTVSSPFEVKLTVTGGGDGGSSMAIPLDVVFALDSSGSMTTNDPQGLRRTASKAFVDKLDSTRDMAAVTSWDNNIDFETQLLSDFDELKAHIDMVDSSGGTNIEIGLQKAVNILDNSPNGDKTARVIILLTDGFGVYSGAAATDAAAKGYRVYSIGLSMGADVSPLKDMADKTGGKFFDSPSAENLQTIFDEIFMEVVDSTLPHNVKVVETTEKHINVDCNTVNPAPKFCILNPDGSTTMEWENVGGESLDGMEIEMMTYTATSSIPGEQVPVDFLPNSNVFYSDSDGVAQTPVPIPQEFVKVIRGGSTFGDPHIMSWNGQVYDFHGGCDLVFLDNPKFMNGLGMTVHVRTKIETWWSYIDAAVVRIGDHVIEMKGGNAEQWCWVDGKPNAKPLVHGKRERVKLGDYVAHVQQKNDKIRKVVVDLHDGTAIVIKSFENIVRVDMEIGKHSDYFNGSLGLMGAYPGGEMVGRDGTSVIEDANAFGMEWQVLASEPKLFHSVEGVQAPEKCAMPTVAEKKSRRRLGEGVISQADAESACAGVMDFKDCVADVLATQDKEFAGAYF